MTERPLLFFCGDLHNLGDLALLLQNLEAAPPTRRLYVRRWSPLPDAIEAQVAAAGGILVSGRGAAFLALAFRSDIVIGGGQLVRDNVSLASLVTQLAAGLAARGGGGRVETRGLGVGRITRAIPRLLWRLLLRLAPVVRVRDEASARNAAALVGEGRVRLTADMAFLPGRLHARASPDTPARHILIAPCTDPGEDRAFDGPGLPLLAAALGKALPDLPIAYAAHDPRPGMDAQAAEALAARGLAGRPPAHGWSLPALLADYHAAALVVTNRLHAIIFALLAGRPVLIVDDGNSKTAAIATRFAIPSVSLVRNGDVSAAVDVALRYDRAARAETLATMARAAAANLAPPASPEMPA